MSTNIHPKFKMEYNVLRYLRFFFPIIGGIAFFIVLFLYIRNSKDNDLLILLFATFGIFLLFSGLPFLFKKNLSTIEEASLILYKNTPVTKTLNSTSIISGKGGVYYLTETDKEYSKDKIFVTLSTSKNKVPKKPPVEVSYYPSIETNSKIIIVDDGKNMFTGTRMEKEEARESLSRSIRFMPLIYLLVALIPIVLFFVLWNEINNSKNFEQYVLESFKWTPVEGKILSTEIQLVKIKHDKNTVDGYNAVIEYEYIVNNKKYRSTTISFDYSASTDFNYTKRLISLFPINAYSPVFYNPHNPKESYLIKANICAIQTHYKTIFISLVVVVFIFIAINIFAIYMVRKTIAKQKELLASL